MTDFKDLLKKTGEIGYIEHVNHYIVQVSGLPTVHLQELVAFETGETGQVISLAENVLEVLVFSKRPLRVGTKVASTGKRLTVPVGEDYLGMAVDPFARPLEITLRLPQQKEEQVVDIYPSGIAGRSRIHRPFETGVRIVDMLVPLGHGQRELVVGDRKTGKTQFVLQAMLTQARLGTVVIYAAIGKKKLDIKRVEEFLSLNKIKDRSLIVASSSEAPAASIFITPYTAMTIAEYFRGKGADVLLVLDDMTTHARFYREIALLGGRFPGRNSYPGDVFHTQARLLERAGNFKGKGDTEQAITALVVAEATQGDLSGYIQTNLMSMTDGHLFFDNDLRTRGHRPAVNTLLSVTRVGRQTQTSLARDISRELSTFFAYYQKMQNFTHFGAELTDNVKRILSMGGKVDAFFQQPSLPTPLPLQLYLFSLLWKGSWQNLDTTAMTEEMEKISRKYAQEKILRQSIEDAAKTAVSFNQFLGILEERQLLPKTDTPKTGGAL